MNGPYYVPGRYVCKITDQALTKAKNGTEQFALKFTVLGLVDPNNPANYIPAQQQYERTAFRAITEKTIDYFIADLKTLGFQGDSFRQLDPSNDGYISFVGNDIDMRCEHDTYEGITREKWGVALVGGGINAEPLDTASVRKLDAMFGKQLKSLKGNGGGNTAPATVKAHAASHEIEDSDIPF